MSEAIESIEKTLHDARKLRYEVESRYEARKSELYREVSNKLNAELGGELSAARSAEGNAAEALRNAENAERLVGASSKLPYPEGPIVRGWESSRSPWAAYRMNRTGKCGVIEIYKEGDAYPSNRSRWSLPKAGEIVVRILKRDGSKGIEAEKYNFAECAKEYWLPEGVEPKCNKKS